MSETATESTTATAAEGSVSQEKSEQTTFSQADVDRIVADRLKRERDKLGDVKALKAAAEELATIKESQKTEAQKTADRLAAAEKEAADARRDALRFRVAAKFQISDEDTDLFLTGDDEATLTKQAERLTARESERKKTGNHVPREGATPPKPTDDPMRSFARNLFGGDPT